MEFAIVILSLQCHANDPRNVDDLHSNIHNVLARLGFRLSCVISIGFIRY